MPDKKPSWKGQSEIADILGVSRQAVQKLCKPGGKFEPALNDKRKINRWHPVIIQHKEDLDAKRKTDPITAAVSEPKKKQTISINGDGHEITVEEIENLTLKQIVERYGGISGFKIYAETLDKMATWKNREMKYQKDRNKLVEKDILGRSLFSIIDLAFKQIVSEYPGSITDQLIAIAKGDRETARIDVVALQEKALSRIMKGIKAEVVKGLKSDNPESENSKPD